MSKIEKDMELKDFVKKLQKFQLLIIVVTLLGGTAGGIFAYLQKPVYLTKTAIFVVPVGVQQQFLTSTNEFTDTVLGILTTSDSDELSGFSFRKIAPQVIQFQTSAKSYEEASGGVGSLPNNLGKLLEKVLGQGNINVTPIASKIESEDPKDKVLLNIAVGLISGFILTVSLSSVVIYFKS